MRQRYKLRVSSATALRMLEAAPEVDARRKGEYVSYFPDERLFLVRDGTRFQLSRLTHFELICELFYRRARVVAEFEGDDDGCWLTFSVETRPTYRAIMGVVWQGVALVALGVGFFALILALLSGEIVDLAAPIILVTAALVGFFVARGGGPTLMRIAARTTGQKDELLGLLEDTFGSVRVALPEADDPYR